MRAVVCDRLEGLDGLSLRELDPPEPAAGQVRVRVRAAGLNFADTLITRGKYQEKPTLPFVPGFEVAGTIDAIGTDVDGVVVGDRVMAVLDHGGFAEYALARAADIVRLSASIDDVTAAAFPIAYGTSHGALRWRADLQPGEILVVHGAAGGVGLTAVECGKAMGATVIATARGSKGEVAREHGADHVLDSEREDLKDAIKALTDGRGADVVYDPIGGKAFEASLRSIAWEGRILLIGFASGDVPSIPANILLVKNVACLGFYWGSYRKHAPERARAGLEEALAWQAQGLIRPHVSETFALEDWRKALEMLVTRKSTGKVVLTL
ncbi:MAG: NADPH:quinone oxidoreductase family protein [Geminicoccaceae bacterium]